MTVKLRAIKQYPYDNKTRNVGDVFEATDSDADALVTVGMAEIIERYDTKVMSTENTAPLVDDKPKRGRYPRRDMRPME